MNFMEWIGLVEKTKYGKKKITYELTFNELGKALNLDNIKFVSYNSQTKKVEITTEE